jgi:hypothetical protein
MGRRKGASFSGGVGDAEEESALLEPWQARSERLAQANPLLMAKSGFGPLSERGQAATAAYEAEAARLPNVLVRPPGDFGGMRTEKQVAWQQNLKNQAELDTQLLQSETTRRQQELADISRKEGLEIIQRSGDLDPTKDDYRAKKAALVRQFPGGATSAEAQAIFKDLDARRTIVESASEEEKKAVTSTERLRGENNFSVARTEAQNLGPEFLGRFLEISKAQGPDAAIAYVSGEGAKSKEANVRRQLGEQMTPEQITEKYGGGEPKVPYAREPFLFGAAEAGVKGAAGERREVRQTWNSLFAARQKAATEGPEALTEWENQFGQMFKNATEDYNSVLGQKNGRGIGDPAFDQRRAAQQGPSVAQPAVIKSGQTVIPSTGQTVAIPPVVPAAPAQVQKPAAPVYIKKKLNPTTGKMAGLNAKTNTWEVIP